MNWHWKKFPDLKPLELYQIISLRERVFVVEQNCVYLDCDGLDVGAWHLFGYQDEELVAYLRFLAPGVKYPEASIGRVVTAPEGRKTGFGKELIGQSLKRIQETFGPIPLRISAQAYLEKFYSRFGFVREGMEYLEDGIPHIEMSKQA